jgi:hypothetical protein
MKPIHKFNNGRGATICNQCSVIITTGLTDDLYCKECNKYRKELLQEIMKEDEALGLYIEQMEKEELKQDCECTDECLGYLTKECKRIEEPEQHVEFINDNIEQFDKAIKSFKQETLEEASDNAWLNYEHVEGNLYSTSFKNGFKLGAKWEQEQDKKTHTALETAISLLKQTTEYEVLH